MNDPGLIVGIVLGAAGASLLSVTFVYPESARRESRRERSFNEAARIAGLRGRYDFTRPIQGGAYGTYEPADEEDRLLFASVGPRIEGEAAFFASELLWTDKRFAWLGVPLLTVGVVLCVISLLG
jgi:hypothetical protein